MRLRSFILSLTSSLQRLRDPQVQVWVMAGLSVLLVLIGHLRAWNASGEGKNEGRATVTRLLLAGAHAQWSEEFAAVTPDQQARPLLLLNTDSSSPNRTTVPAPTLAVRLAMQTAANQPWQALNHSLRQRLELANIPVTSLKIHLSWNGDARGNAASVARQQIPFADAILPPSAAQFVIGNGSRSGDGEIECFTSDLTFTSDSVKVTLIGRAGLTTPAQLTALAELLVHLEALSGHPLENSTEHSSLVL